MAAPANPTRADVAYAPEGGQLLRIVGDGLKDAGATEVYLGNRRLALILESDKFLQAQCPADACADEQQRLTITTYSSGVGRKVVSSIAIPLGRLVGQGGGIPKDDEASVLRLVEGSYGPAVCARNVTPPMGDCPIGYVPLALAEMTFGDASNCQSDNGGDVPLVKVKPLCKRQR